MELPEGFIDFVNKQIPGVDFIDEEDFNDFIDAEDNGADMLSMLLYQFENQDEDSIASDDVLSDPEADIDAIADGSELSEGDALSDASCKDKKGCVSDEKCKDIIEDDSNKELYNTAMSWARKNYEPAKGMSEQEISARFAMNTDDWGTKLATAYFESLPEDDDSEAETEVADDAVESADNEATETNDDIVEEAGTVTVAADTDGDGDIDEVSVDITGDGTDDTAIKNPLDDTMKNILHTLTDHRY